jgi:Ca2+-binding EF-hand superfamily protein
MFDSSKAGKIENEKIRTILNTLGLAINDLELEALLEEEDKEGNVQQRSIDSPLHSAVAYIQGVS